MERKQQAAQEIGANCGEGQMTRSAAEGRARARPVARTDALVGGLCDRGSNTLSSRTSYAVAVLEEAARQVALLW
jgi:hypothetical protein